MRNGRTMTLVLGLTLATLARAEAPVTDGAAAFARLKGLAGTWAGHVDQADGPQATVRWELISADSAVMETLFPGTPHEMRTVYFLDHGALVLTHYCAAGNQPHMRLAAGGTPGELRFTFDGGTNLDPARDVHMHEVSIRLVDAEHVETEWVAWKDGRRSGAHRFLLTRAR